MDDAIRKIAIRLAEGESHDTLCKELEETGLSKPEAAALISHINQELNKVRQKAHDRASRKGTAIVAAMQIGLLAAAALCAYLFHLLYSYDGCILNISIGELCVIDTVLLTALGSAVATGVLWAGLLFNAYP